MSKIYEALGREERCRIELERPDVSPIRESFLIESPSIPEIEQEMVSLYYSISSMLAPKEGKVIQFVGSTESEGTSTVAQEFGRITAMELGKAVLLLKADGTDPEEELDFLGNKGTPDVMRLMRNGIPMEEAFSNPGEGCFSVCPVSARRNSTSSILTSPRLDGVFQKLKEHYDLILLDSPPVNNSPKALAICQKVDGVILVVEAEKTRWRVAESAKRRIVKAGGNILGVVLNKRRYYIPATIYNRL